MIKKEIRILGIDDGPFSRNQKEVIVVGVVIRGNSWIDGILRTYVKVDGLDATKKIAEMVNKSNHKKQLKVVMLDGITLGGFNLVDIKELHEKIELPIIVINRKMPDLKKVREALEKHFKDFKKRWKIIQNAGEIKKFISIKNKPIFYQVVGMDDEKAKEIINLSIGKSDIPEALRIAHLIATGIVLGESRGRA
ncbi:MAG: hypothetical protein B6U78_01120 [Candidatus Aenigmarchaeota archaeon ex4484_224]|nr:MAG: hypothetical protein B6U78_01120 [Candidatus Aenigmarchaeota archaeon ex4484_224]